MQRAPVTVEEQLLQKAIKEECTWENLPKRIQAILSSKEEWHRRRLCSRIIDGGYTPNCWMTEGGYALRIQGHVAEITILPLWWSPPCSRFLSRNIYSLPAIGHRCLPPAVAVTGFFVPCWCDSFSLEMASDNTFSFSGSPSITSEKLNGKNYLSWSAAVEMWFLGQGHYDQCE
ncbi:hypothetical protein V8G54_033886 [Vigna mungo]|uniref:Retrotransposon Copia-like N-terminal domain-containing protein n=1 Tax=Vigna mungo TaxID=3915 RepID=A0AAQ3RJE8_VIGMU